MKKLIAFTVAAVAAVSLATAEITVGVRGIFGVGLGTTLADNLNDAGYDLDLGGTLNAGGPAFVKIPVFASLVVQPELGFTHNMVGMEFEKSGVRMTMDGSYNAIDIPVLVGWDFKINDNFTVTPLVGPKISIPVGNFTGKMEMDMPGYSYSQDIDAEIDSPVLFSIVVGVGVAYKVGPGAIVGDVRYNIGVSDLKDESGAFATPRSLQLSVGYQISF